MKYIVENFAEGVWWRFTQQPFDTEAEALGHIKLMLKDFPSDTARLRVREYPPSEHLFDAIVEDIENHEYTLLRAMISILRETTIERLLKFYETDAPPGGADRGDDGNEPPSTGPANL